MEFLSDITPRTWQIITGIAILISTIAGIGLFIYFITPVPGQGRPPSVAENPPTPEEDGISKDADGAEPKADSPWWTWLLGGSDGDSDSDSGGDGGDGGGGD